MPLRGQDFKALVLSFIFALCFCQPLNAHQSPSEMLQISDRSRGGLSQGVVWKLNLISKDAGTENQFEYEVKVKNSQAIAKCLAPARSKNEVYLFLDRNLWMYRPGLRKALSLSTRQKLSGQAANGDIANTNYARDYSATLLGEEVIDKKRTFKLKLKAKSDDLTYDQIIYWISQDKLLAVKADFLSVDGQVFKSAVFNYENSIQVEGKSLPFVSRMLITDAKNPKLVSELNYSQIKIENLSDSEFNVNNLSK